MKKYWLYIALLLPSFAFAQPKEDKNAPKTYDLLVSGYTGDSPRGISVYRFYEETGKVAYLSQSEEVKNPSYFCISKDNKFVYAVSENGASSEVYAYSFDPKYGQLKFINKQLTNGADACHISVDEDRKNLFVANYSSGSLSVLPLKEDGSILPVTQLIQEKGSGVNKERQEGPHVHNAVLSPDEKYLLYTDLGNDKINITRYKNGPTEPLTPASTPFVKVAAGTGPRHLEFSPDKKHLYVIQELTSDVTAFDYSGGKLKQIQTVTMLPDGFKGNVGAADIHISPDGLFLYASDRGDVNNIVVYSIAPETGMLTFVDRTKAMIKNPRNFVIDPNGKFLLVANQGSNTVYVYRRDKTTGKLSPTYNKIDIDKPTCLKFTSAQPEK